MGYGIYLIVLVIAFVGIVIWAYGRKRKARFNKDAAIPFDDRKK
ncbi:MAG: cbb3-type cytochrome oxidase subunit 3 [Reyranella sp.]